MNLQNFRCVRRFTRFFSANPKFTRYLTGVIAGFLGGIFGSGGGIVTAFALRCLQKDWEEKDRLAATLCTVLPSVAVAAVLYSLRGGFPFASLLPMLPASVAGGILGALVSRRVKGELLRMLFAGMLLIGGVLLLFG